MKLSKFILIGSLSISMLHLSAYSAEVDQFTRRGEFLGDSAELLNSKANLAIKNSIKAANRRGEGCNEEALYKELREYFANHIKGELVKDILDNPDIPKRHINLKDSVYRDWSFWDGIGIGFTLIAKKGITMSDVIRVGDEEIGVDKLEHMFGQGFNYFKRNYLKEKGEVAAVKKGIFGEKFILGGQKIGNGVFSYGDLSANFNGMRFWNHMLQLREDVLGADFNIGPYITCENDKWVKAKDLDFRNYLDDSMNESINCSKFPSGNTVDKFKDRLRLMGTSCPVDQKRLDDVIVKYRHMSKWIINPDGPGEVKYFREFKDKE